MEIELKSKFYWQILLFGAFSSFDFLLELQLIIQRSL